MKNVLMALLVGIILGGSGVWYIAEWDRTPVLQAIGLGESAARTIGEAGADAAGRARAIVDAKLEALDLQTGTIREEMTLTGKVVRRKARELGYAVADAAADASTTARIKAALLRDPDLSAWDVSVSTTDGHVTLSGEATSTREIGRAILLAYEIPGVQEVTSTLRVKESRS